ncbi:hypothetical protein D3C86_1518350 [compost metagenome]
MRHFDCPGRTIKSDGQRVIADHPHRGGGCGGGQGAVTGGGQQQVAIDLIVAFQSSGLASTGQCPELATTFQYPGGFQLVAGNFGQVAIELQDFTRLYDLVSVGAHRQRSLGVGAVEYLLFREGMNTSQVPDGIRLEVDRAVLDLPVHPGFPLPDF